MKKILVGLFFLFILLTGCQKKVNVDEIYTDFTNSKYIKSTLCITTDNQTEKIGTIEKGYNHYLFRPEQQSLDFVYLIVNPKLLKIYMLEKYTTLPLEGYAALIDAPVLEKEKTDFGFVVRCGFNEEAEGISKTITLDVNFYLTKNRVTKISFLLPKSIIPSLEKSTEILFEDIEYGEERNFDPDVSSYEYLEGSLFIDYCLSELFPGEFPLITKYELESHRGHTIITKLNEEVKLEGDLTIGNSYKIYDVDLTIEDTIDYSKPGEYFTTAYTMYKGIKYTTKVCIQVVEPNYEFEVFIYGPAPLNGEVEFSASLYDPIYGLIIVSEVKFSDNLDLTKEGIYEVTVSTEYEGKIYSKVCEIEVKEPRYEIVLNNEYDLIAELNNSAALENLTVDLVPSSYAFTTYDNLKPEITGTIDFTKVGNYPITLSVTCNGQKYTKDFCVQVVDPSITLEKTIELQEKIVDSFIIDNYLLLATSTSLYKYDMLTNQIVGSVDLKCQYNNYYYRDSFLYVTANYPYTDTHLNNNKYSGTVNKISFEDFSLVSQVEVNLFPYGIIVNNRNQAIVKLGMQDINLVSLDFETQTWKEISYTDTHGELYYDVQEDSFVLIYPQSEKQPKFYTWNSATSSYSYINLTTEFGYHIFRNQGQYIANGVVLFDSTSIYKYTFPNTIQKIDLSLQKMNCLEDNHLEGNTLYKLYFFRDLLDYTYIVKYDLETNSYDYKKIRVDNSVYLKFEVYQDTIYLLNDTTGKIEVYSYKD